MVDVHIHDSGVNEGTSIKLRMAKVTYAWKNLIQKNTPASRFYTTKTGSDYPQVKTNFLGWENPTFFIEGRIDTSSSATDVITVDLLRELAKSQTQAFIYDPYIFPAGSSAAPETPCQVEDFNVVRSAVESQDGYFLTYTMLVTIEKTE